MVVLLPNIQIGRGKLWHHHRSTPLFRVVLKNVVLYHRLFHSHIVDVAPQSHKRTVFDVETDWPLFSIKYNDEDGLNDLVGCLANQIFPKSTKRGSLNADPGTAGGRAITEPADVIAFATTRDESLPSYQDTVIGKPQQRRKFSFPDSLYLDRFLMTNHERAREVIQNANVAEDEIRRLVKKKYELTKLDVRGVRFASVFGKLIGVTEQGCDEEYPILTLLLRECSTISGRCRTTRSHRKFCGQAQEHHCAHRG